MQRTDQRFHAISKSTVPDNLRSRKVMERIGMAHDVDVFFAHPKLPVDHPLSKHVLYRIKKS
ncbi:MAG: hypothetical protein HYX60_11315 [Legionella longbeachae]|nr:hypothetical protein [Legionella longbeachae]